MQNTDFPEKKPFDLEQIKSAVGHYFPFYDIKVEREAITFFCRIDEERLEENFESLRVSLSSYGYIPIIRREAGETVIHVVMKPEKKTRSIWVNLTLFSATLLTTMFTGALLVSGEITIWGVSNLSAVFSLNNLIEGFMLFSLPLLTILGVHEMGHYFVSKMHGIATSLPFFIPVPPIFSFNIGTFGALISSRDPLSNRKILFDVGIAGPVAGFIVAIPITVFGVMTSEIIPRGSIEKGSMVLGSSLFFDFLYSIFVPPGYAINFNPVAFAGWVGLLVTSINLLPAGQLDGGHIARAVLGEKQRYAAWFSVIPLLFTPWWFFALLIVLVFGATHPPPLNELSPLDIKRKLLSFVALLMFIICFVPFPFYPAELVS